MEHTLVNRSENRSENRSNCRENLSQPHLEASTGQLAVRIEQLEQTQLRISHELLEWKMQIQVANEATYSAWLSEASAEAEERTVTKGLRTLEANIDVLLGNDAAEALGEAWSEIFLDARARREALRERQIEARLKLQICRRHCQLQQEILEHVAAALKRAEQRSGAIGKEIAALRYELQPREDSAA